MTQGKNLPIFRLRHTVVQMDRIYRLACLMCLTSCCVVMTACTKRLSTADAPPVQIVCIGDSHTAKGIWPQSMAAALNREISLELLAKGGITAEQILAHIQQGEWLFTSSAGAERYCLVLIGTNAYDIQALQNLVDELVGRGEQVFVLTTPPRRAKAGAGWSPAHANRVYNDQLRALFGPGQRQVTLIDVIHPLLDHRQAISRHADVIDSAYDADGVHLNKQGYDYFGQLIAAELDRLLALD